MRKLSSAFLASPIPLPPAMPQPPSAYPPSQRSRLSASSVSDTAAAAPQARLPKKIQEPEAVSSTYTSLVSSSSPPTDGVKARSFRPSPELGLLSLLFVLSMAISSLLCMAIVSLPAMNAFRRLAASMKELLKVVSMEVPGTLSSLKLSGLEISQVTRKLSNLRQKIPGSSMKKERGGKN